MSLGAESTINPPSLGKAYLLFISVYFNLAANEKDLSQGNWKDKEKVQIETLDEVLDVEMGTMSENEEENYYAVWKYKDAYYELSGQIEKEEIVKILNGMQYNL